MVANFDSLYFGKSAAEREVADNEERFVATFYDHWKAYPKFLNGDFFLLLGPKGSGKTAISEYSPTRSKSFS